MMSKAFPFPRRLMTVFRALRTREKWFNGFGLIVVLISLLMGTATYAIVSEQTLLTNKSSRIYQLITLHAM